ncbi:MAG: helix-turn-helix transcriptional regulator [Chitinophagaceae bacterium]
MNLNLTIQTLSHTPLQFKPVLPVGYKGIVVPGSTPFLAKGLFGSYLIQEIKDELFLLHFSLLEIIQPFVVQFHSAEKGLFTRLALHEGFYLRNEKRKDFKVRAGEFIRLQLQSPGAVVQYDAHKKYIHVDTYFSQELVEEALKLFPTVDIHKVPAPKRADNTTSAYVDSILHCKYMDPLRRYFFNNRVKDILINHLVQWSQQDPEGGKHTKVELDAARTAEKIISTDISLHYTLPELARMVHLGEYRFKKVFKSVYGLGAYEYLANLRMKKAKQMIEEGYSVKEAAAETGYHVSYFIDLFKETFGITPGKLAKNKK